jgi:phosphate transport system ATP-binding protein
MVCFFQKGDFRGLNICMGNSYQRQNSIGSLEETKVGPDPTAETRDRAGANPAGASAAARTMIEVDRVDFCYRASRALHDISLRIAEKKVTAFIGPSGCGKSTLLRCFNRMNDLIDHARITAGEIRIEGQDINSADVDVTQLRKRVGMVFQKSNPFPKSIYENIAFGLRIAGVSEKRIIEDTIEDSLSRAALWDEVKDRLHKSALGLSGGQPAALVYRPGDRWRTGDHLDG